MRIDWQIGSHADWRADAIIFFGFEKSSEPLPGLKRWTEDEGAWLASSEALGDFLGKHQSVAVYYAPEGRAIPRVLCVGLGPAAELDLERLRSAAASALRKCKELRLTTVAIPLTAFEGLPVETATALEESLIGSLTGIHQFDAFKTRDREETSYPETLVVLGLEEPGEGPRTAASSALAIAAGICLARDLVDAPANQATPSHLVKTAELLASEYDFRLELMETEKALSLGMGAFAAVAQGSREPAYMLVIEHAPSGTEEDPPLVLIGKGITFDTGGISLKPSDKLESMKHDMAGAAAVLGVFDILGKTRLPRRVIGILPCTENMPDGKAYKPGDILRSASGLSIEVISTDAEGRLVLCDALHYAQRFKPAVIIDIATLTGACIVALGRDVAGVMGNRDSLTQELQAIGTRLGERLWPLPLWDFYLESIKSDVADLKNVGDRSAGAIIGGIFLKQFVPDEIPWAHLDIAGTAWSDKAPRGATAFGVRILIELARRWPEIKLEER